jgi:hypothetical protein
VGQWEKSSVFGERRGKKKPERTQTADCALKINTNKLGVLAECTYVCKRLID